MRKRLTGIRAPNRAGSSNYNLGDQNINIKRYFSTEVSIFTLKTNVSFSKTYNLLNNTA